MFETIFYIYGCFYLVTLIWDLAAKNFKEDIHTDLKKMDLQTAKKQLKRVKFLGYALTILGTAWKFVGLWMPEKAFFITLIIVAVIVIVLSILARNNQARKGVNLFSLIVQLILTGVILYLHYAPLYLI